MSTKNLARTVIEGGRSHYNQHERRSSHAVERSMTRETLHRMASEHDGLERYTFGARPHVYKGFSDKLAPARRWLLAQVGRPWANVRSELFARFDTRTTAGRHIVFDHLLRWVREHELREPYRRHLVRVGKNGILQRCGAER